MTSRRGIRNADRTDLGGYGGEDHAVRRGADPDPAAGHLLVDDGDDRFRAAGVEDCVGGFGGTGNRSARRIDFDCDRFDGWIIERFRQVGPQQVGRRAAGDPRQPVSPLLDDAAELQNGDSVADFKRARFGARVANRYIALEAVVLLQLGVRDLFSQSDSLDEAFDLPELRFGDDPGRGIEARQQLVSAH